MGNRDGERLDAPPSGFERYLALLPDGLDSYPECQSKGSLVLSALHGHDVEEMLLSVPPELKTLLTDPPPAAMWTPAVRSIALIHYVADRYYPTDADVMAWSRRRTERVAETPLYSSLLRVSSPRIFFSMTAKVNRLFQRGTFFDILSSGSNHVTAKLAFPEHLHSRRSLMGTAAMCEVIMERTGGKSGRAEMVEITPTHARFECEWQ